LSFRWIWRGRVPYAAALSEMQSLWEERRQGRIPDTLLLLEHPPVLTIGRTRARSDICTPPEVLAAQGFEIHEIDRGGRVTYHGPGQLVAYPVFEVGTSPLNAAGFVRRLAEVMISLLQAYSVDGRWDPECPGTWVEGEKIGAIGVRIEAGVSRHGFAFNVDPDLSHFRHIIACGLEGKGTTSLARVLGRAIPVEEVAARTPGAFERVFRSTAQPWR
jgi:lipoyl(octanoyl) transferase